MSAEKEQLLTQLRAFTPDNFRRQRWIVIDNARHAGLTWNEIAEALETQRPGAIRMYREFTRDDFIKRPSDAN